MPGTGRTLATAFLEVRPDGKIFRAELKSETESAGATAGTSSGNRFAEAMKRAIKTAGLALAVGTAFVGLKALQFLKDANRDASDLNETVSKAQNIYPKTQAALNKFAQTSATALGLSRQQALEGAASFGNFFNQIGIGEKQSLKMSTALIKLSADLGSFSNADPSEVMESFLSATRGEYDSLQKFIPTVNAARIQTEALRITHKKSADDLTDADKALALYRISMRDAGKATGDFARTAQGQANATRTWHANLADIRAEIGTALMPVVTQFINALNTELVPVIKSLWAEHGPQVTAFLSQMVDNLKNAGPWITNLANQIKAFFTAQNSAGGGPTLAENLSDATKSAKELLPVIKEFVASLPSLNDLVNVAGTVLGFLADHTEELKEAMPLLVAAVVAFKVAQLASNIAVAASPIFKIADTIATRQQTAALRAQTAALTANKVATAATTVATASETTAQNVSLITRLRATAAMVAQRTIMLAIRAATIAWTAVQWLLNAALTANPIGLVIAAIALLVAGIIYAYKHSETFRNIVQATWRGIQVAIKATVDWVVNVAWPFLQRAWDGIVAAVKFAVQLWVGYMNLIRSIISAVFRYIADFISDRINFVVAVIRRIQQIVAIVRNAVSQANATIIEKFTEAVNWVRGLPGRIISALGNLGRTLYNAGRDLVQGMINGIGDMIGRLVDKVKGMVSSIPSAVKKILDIASPSRVMYRLGQFTMRGFLDAVDDSAPGIEAAITRVIGPRFRPAFPPSATSGGAASRGGGINIEQMTVKAYSDRFSLKQVQEDLALNGVH